MNLLALETSADVGSTAILQDGRILAERLVRAPMNLLSWLSPTIQEMLKETNLDMDQIDAIATGIGPGSFTGVRLQLATARTLAQVRGIPLYGISSLEALAFQVIPYTGMILSCIDARRKELFFGIFEAKGLSLWQKGDYESLPPSMIVEKATLYKGPWVLVGEINPYRTYLLEQFPGMCEAHASSGIVRASSIGALAFLRKDLLSGDIYAVHPLYIRASNAEIEKKKVIS